METWAKVPGRMRFIIFKYFAVEINFAQYISVRELLQAIAALNAAFVGGMIYYLHAYTRLKLMKVLLTRLLNILAFARSGLQNIIIFLSQPIYITSREIGLYLQYTAFKFSRLMMEYNRVAIRRNNLRL